jgi:hypothetical protein
MTNNNSKKRKHMVNYCLIRQAAKRSPTGHTEKYCSWPGGPHEGAFGNALKEKKKDAREKRQKKQSAPSSGGADADADLQDLKIEIGNADAKIAQYFGKYEQMESYTLHLGQQHNKICDSDALTKQELRRHDEELEDNKDSMGSMARTITGQKATIKEMQTAMLKMATQLLKLRGVIKDVEELKGKGTATTTTYKPVAQGRRNHWGSHPRLQSSQWQ